MEKTCKSSNESMKKELGDTIEQKFSCANLPVFSLVLLQDNEIIDERYYNGFTSQTLHRMYSIAKSFTSIAIGILIEEGKLSLSDCIADFFPEYVRPFEERGAEGPVGTHPFILKMTIRDMLTMQTCFDRTTYKRNPEANWVESFFITYPDHESGNGFHYDTSSAHTLAALVEKLSGMKMMDFLRRKLGPLGLSQEAHFLSDPFGSSDGGSGLMCTTKDLIAFAKLISGKGFYDGKQIISSDYIELATSKLVETTNSSVTPTFPSYGYGFMFWRGPRDSYLCYGMDGQFIIFCPECRLIAITTANTHGIKGGDQAIAEAVFSGIYEQS